MTIGKTFSRLANRNQKILHECALMMQKAIKLDESKSEYFSELGYVYTLLGDWQQAEQTYQQALKLNAQDVYALEGVIRVCIAKQQYQSAKDQLELFNEIRGSMGLTDSISYMNGIIEKQLQQSSNALEHFRNALRVAHTKIKRNTSSMEFYGNLNPDFVLVVAKEYLDIVEALEVKNVGFCNDLLELLTCIVKMIPGMAEARFLLARVYLLLQDTSAAEKQLVLCISKSKENYKAHLLMAEIQIRNKNFDSAFSALEMALSRNFQIRHDLEFVVLKARCLNGLQKYDDAVVTLKSAFQLPIVKESIKSLESMDTKSLQVPPLLIVSLYVHLIEAQLNTKYSEEGSMTMNYATRLFSGSPYEGNFTLLRGKNLMRQNQIQKALEVLQTIKSDQPGYLEARKLMADIYLLHKHDRKRYANCFREVVDQNPTIDSCLLLGDAYMKIQEVNELNVARKGDFGVSECPQVHTR
jgi:tetratricopeptide repeat protein 21B